MKRVFFIAAFFVSTVAIMGQSGYLVDGMRFSENIYGSTARNVGIGSASSSLGGDLGSTAINPAGIGVYRSSEFVFSPSLNMSKVSSTFLGNKTDEVNNNFGFNNIGLLLNFKSNSGDWQGFSLAFGYNKLNDYSQRFSIKGATSNISFTDELLNNANGKLPADQDDYWEGIAYDVFVIDTVPGSGKTTYWSPFTNKNLSNTHMVEVKGSLGEYFFGLGANLNNKFYIGGSLNIRSGYYQETMDHTEVNTENGDYYTFSRYINSYYRGFNAKLGVIYRPIENLRLGLSLHTPTVGQVNMDLDSKIVAGVNNAYNSSAPQIKDEDQLTISSPARFITGASYLFGQVGLLSVDYEYADYSSVNFSEGYFPSGIDSANNDVKTFLKATHNIRIGGEVKLQSLYFRGGFAYYGSPYTNATYNKSADTKVYSGGIGYRTTEFYVDLSYSLKSNNSYYSMYNNASLSNIKAQNSSYLVTVGFRF